MAIRDLSILLSFHNHTTSHTPDSSPICLSVTQEKPASLASAHTVPSAWNTLPCFFQLIPPHLSILFRCLLFLEAGPLLHEAIPGWAPTVRGWGFSTTPHNPVSALTILPQVFPSGLSASGDGSICPRRPGALCRQGWDCIDHLCCQHCAALRPAIEVLTVPGLKDPMPSRPHPLLHAHLSGSHTQLRSHTLHLWGHGQG